MTPRTRRPGGGSSGTPSGSSSRPNTSDATTRPLGGGGGGGGGTTVNLGDLDTMTVRLNATGGKVDAVGTTVGGINVGPQSMGIVGGNFTGAAQTHLKTAQQHVTKTRQAVDNARTGTTETARLYRDREQTNKVNLEKSYGDGTTVPNTANQPTVPNTANRPTTPNSANNATVPNTANAPTVPAGANDTTVPKTVPAGANDTTLPKTRPLPSGGDGGSSIGDRLNPPDNSSRPDPGAPPWQQSDRANQLQNQRIVNLSPLGPGGNVNEAFLAELDDGSRGAYKPVSGEQTAGMRQDITSDLGRREVAASRVDEMLGFNRVPTTVMVDGPHGPGSLQAFAENSGPGLDAHDYPRVQQQQMAVLDYITGNTDRHGGNYLTGPDGSVVAIDHGFSFPDGTRDAIRSDFVRDQLNQPLDPSVADAVRNVDPNAMRYMLQESGLSPTAVDLSMARLAEIQQRGMITGENWPGPIVDAWWGPVRGPLAP